MVMRTIAIFLIFVLIVRASIISLAQNTVANIDTNASSAKSEATNRQNASEPSANEGPQNLKQQQKDSKTQIYVGNDWAIGTIVLRNGDVIDNYYLRYNLLADQLEFIAGNDTLIFANPQDINTVTFDGHTFIYENYQYDTTIREGYFELIVPGKNKLMLKRSVTGQNPYAKNTDKQSPSKYKVDECYFISKTGMPASKLACNRKSALTFLNDHNEDISEYLRITGNKVRTIEDLKLLVSYYNSLDEEY